MENLYLISNCSQRLQNLFKRSHRLRLAQEQAKSYAPDQFMDALGIYRPQKLPLKY